MRLIFNKVILHNFGSYEHSELSLKDRGFCLVSGKNHYKKDNASSNGCGKSLCWSAISYALTGETINGLTKGLKNIYAESDDCYVSLFFSFDEDSYEITRYAAPKTDLKVVKNGTDISGKGIRESEKVLSDMLPSLTKDLIASSIILGQGMPNKFSSYSPSGRKELLEKLARTDYQIQDLKDRIANRTEALNTELRQYEDSELSLKTKLSLNKTKLEQIESQLSSWKPIDETEITKKKSELTDIDTQLSDLQVKKESLQKEESAIFNQQTKLAAEKSDAISNLTDAYNTASSTKFDEKAKLSVEIQTLKSEITKIESITDICPTCGQKIIGITKPDPTPLKEQLKEKQGSLSLIEAAIVDINNKQTNYRSEINNKYDGQLSELVKNITSIKEQIQAIDSSSLKLQQDKLKKTVEISTLTENFNNNQKLFNYLTETKNQALVDIKSIEDLITTTELGKANTNDHIAVVKKMKTLSERDFRGFLLLNIINYLNAKIKEFGKSVFNTDDLNLSLSGNALDITYCNKPFDNLSGGEKTRVDIILQLAIRDLLQTYLNFETNIIVLDEVTDFLDATSCKAVLALLSNQLKDVESVFIISHHAAELEIPIDSEITIIKDEYGISSIC